MRTKATEEQTQEEPPQAQHEFDLYQIPGARSSNVNCCKRSTAEFGEGQEMTAEIKALAKQSKEAEPF